MNKKHTINLTSSEVKDIINLLEQATELAVDYDDSELAEVYISLTDKIYSQAKV